MRACARCGHHNPEPLAYCFHCGGRLRGGAGWADGPQAKGGSSEGAGPTAGFAATVPLVSASRPASGPPSTAPQPVRGPVRSVLHAVPYLWGYVRGRIHAEDRKRLLADERQGAERMIEATLAELGASAIAGPAPPPELAEAAVQVADARQRRDAAIADLTSAEKLQAVEDMRLGLDQTAAESEWKACTGGAAEMDQIGRAHV